MSAIVALSLPARRARAFAPRIRYCEARGPAPQLIQSLINCGADGSLTGFGGGLHVKRFLLEHEGALLPLG